MLRKLTECGHGAACQRLGGAAYVHAARAARRMCGLRRARSRGRAGERRRDRRSIARPPTRLGRPGPVIEMHALRDQRPWRPSFASLRKLKERSHAREHNACSPCVACGACGLRRAACGRPAVRSGSQSSVSENKVKAKAKARSQCNAMQCTALALQRQAASQPGNSEVAAAGGRS